MSYLRATRTVAPTVKPITLEQAKASMSVLHSDDDDLIEDLIDAVVDYLDGPELGRCLINQTWQADFSAWDSTGRLRLPWGNVQSITSVKYLDTDGAEQTVTSTDYAAMLDDSGPYVQMIASYVGPGLSTNRDDGVRVTYVAGYGATADTVPASIRAAIRIMVADLYDNRSSVGPNMIGKVPVSLTVERLLMKHRRMWA